MAFFQLYSLSTDLALPNHTKYIREYIHDIKYFYIYKATSISRLSFTRREVQRILNRSIRIGTKREREREREGTTGNKNILYFRNKK